MVEAFVGSSNSNSNSYNSSSSPRLVESKRRQEEWKSMGIDNDRLQSILRQRVTVVGGGTTGGGHRRSYSHSFLILSAARESFSSLHQYEKRQQERQEQKQREEQQERALQNWSIELRRILDYEIEKTVLFSIQEQGQIAKELSHLLLPKQQCLERVTHLCQQQQQQQRQCQLESSLDPSYYHPYDDGDDDQQQQHQMMENQIQELYEKYQSLAQRVLDYVTFCERNVMTARKILKKHDKLQPWQTLTKTYTTYHHYPPTSAVAVVEQKQQNNIRMMMENHSSHFLLQQLYNHDGGLSSIIASLATSLNQLYHAKKLLQAIPSLHGEGRIFPHPSLSSSSNRMSTLTPSRHQRTLSMPVLAAVSDVEIGISNTNNSNNISNSNPVIIPSVFASLSSTPTTTTTMTTMMMTSFKEPLLDQIYAARSRLHTQSSKYVELIATRSLIFQGDDEEEEEVYHDTVDDHPPLPDGISHDHRIQEANRKRRKKISSLLNLASTFFYMTSYYIVAPTTGQYALQLGSTEAMAGIIIGMTPNAALIATVLYGWWSNYAYKSALLFAAGSSLVGNLCYALALRRHSIHLVMLGRFLNGFGSARSINRRFIADTFSRAERTAESAAFVTAGAMGMAAGPAIAALLGIWFRHFPSSNLTWTVETAPGWVMLTFWSAYFATTLIYFEEPDRSHLFGKATPSRDRHVVKTETSTTDESRPLLSSRMETNLNGKPNLGGKESLPLYRNVPVMMTLWLYFLLKLVLECLLSSCATLTGFLFGWDSQHKGAFLAFLGGLMIPVNLVVAKLSQNYEDRELILGTLIIMFLSAVGILDYSTSYSVFQYAIFSICLFVSANVLEGPNMSLLSKTIPKIWARGTFNSGFLATEAGTAARSIGNLLVSASVALYGVDRLLNSTFIPVVVFVGFSAWWTVRLLDELVEDDEDDDESNRVGTNENSNTSLGTK